MSFWSELKRRNVFKVGAAYVIVAWLIVQVANTFFPIFHIPDWAVTLVAFLLVLGLPVTLIIAWAFELTPEGVKRSENVPLDESITHVTGRKLDYVLVGLIVVLVGYIVIDKAFVSKGFVETKVTTPVAEQAVPATEVKEAPKTIAVLPFENLSSDPEQEYFVDGLSEEILNSLTKVPDLFVTSRTSSFYFKNTDTTVQKIADVLNVSYILEGSVRKAENALRITAQLIRVADDRHLWSNIYDRELKDIFAIQEDIANAVADELKVTLGIGEALKQKGGTDNIEAYNLYLVCLGQTLGTDIGRKRALSSINAALELDPKFALAWALKARIHLSNRALGPADRVTEERYAGLIAVEQALALAPNLLEANIILGTYRLQSGNLVEAELVFRKVLDQKNNFLWSDMLAFPIIHYMAVGRLKKAQGISELILQNDPLNEDVRIFYIHTFTQLGNPQRAEEENKRAKALIGDQWGGLTPQIRIQSGDVALIDGEVTSLRFYATLKEHLDSPKDALAELRRIYDDGNSLSHKELLWISEWAAYFGDPYFALETMEKGLSIDFVGTFSIWYPVMHEVRQLPRFKEFVREIGLVDYWEKFGWPDLCRPLDDGDFECD